MFAVDGEALCTSYLNAVGCDSFFAMISSAEKPTIQKNIEEMSQSVIADFRATDVPRSDLPDCVSESCSVVLAAFSCLLAILSPKVGYLGTSPNDVIEVMTQNDSSTFLGTLKLYLVGNPWERLIDEIIKVGSKNLVETQTWLGHCLAQLKEQGSVALTDSAKCVPEVLHSLSKEYPERKKKSKVGQLKDLEQEYKNEGIEAARRLISLKDVDQIQPADVRVVHLALETFAKEATVLDFKKKLSAWESSQASGLDAKQVEESLELARLTTDRSKQMSMLQELFRTRKVLPEGKNKEVAAEIVYKVMSEWSHEDSLI